MTFNIDELKKKIIYRSSYRGSKEMDYLLSSFVQSILNELNDNDLINLSNLLNIDDENLYKYNQNLKTNINISENYVSRLFKKYRYKKK